MKQVAGKVYLSKNEAIKHNQLLADYAAALEGRLQMVRAECDAADKDFVFCQRGHIAKIRAIATVPEPEQQPTQEDQACPLQ